MLIYIIACGFPQIAETETFAYCLKVDNGIPYDVGEQAEKQHDCDNLNNNGSGMLIPPQSRQKSFWIHHIRAAASA